MLFYIFLTTTILFLFVTVHSVGVSQWQDLEEKLTCGAPTIVTYPGIKIPEVLFAKQLEPM